MFKKLKHIIKEYRKVKALCGMTGGKVMKFRKYLVYKWKDLKGVKIHG